MKRERKKAFRILAKKFGKEHAEYLLWNETSYPFDPETFIAQAKKLVRRAGVAQR